jgi:hypothetical protein
MQNPAARRGPCHGHDNLPRQEGKGAVGGKIACSVLKANFNTHPRARGETPRKKGGP